MYHVTRILCLVLIAPVTTLSDIKTTIFKSFSLFLLTLNDCILQPPSIRNSHPKYGSKSHLEGWLQETLNKYQTQVSTLFSKEILIIYYFLQFYWTASWADLCEGKKIHSPHTRRSYFSNQGVQMRNTPVWHQEIILWKIIQKTPLKQRERWPSKMRVNYLLAMLVCC